MKLVTFTKTGEPRIGCLNQSGSEIVDFTAAGIPGDMNEFIGLGDCGLQQAVEIVEENRGAIPIAVVALLAPIPRPRRNIMCVGKNYVAHAAEFEKSGFDASNSTGADVPKHPIIFTKAPTSVIRSGEAIPGYLDSSDSTDYEGELGVVIGRGGRGISAKAAMEHVYGYTVVNDVTARYLQRDHTQWVLGKSIDGFCPMGPCIVTADEIADIREMRIQTTVNNEIRQDAEFSQLIFDIPTLIETISRGITLETGDIIATGTPEGVGIGFDPPKFLRTGDVVKVTIDGIGSIQNIVE